MRSAVAVVADDLTGAADAGAGFLRAGLTVLVTWAEPAIDARLFGHADVLAIDARTRAVDASEARARTQQVVAQAFDAGVGLLYKKMDSMLRGHIGEEIDGALAGWHPGAIALVAPAFPAMGRTTVDGRQRVHGVTLDRPSLPTLLERAGVRAAHVDVTTVRTPALVDRIDACRREGMRAIVCDADADHDLAAIAEAGTRLGPHLVWVGTGGLAHAMSAHVAAMAPRTPVTVTAQPAPTRGTVLTVVGSTSDVAREQVNHERARGVTHVEIPAAALTDDPADAAVFVAALETALRAGSDVIVSLDGTTTERRAVVERLAARLAPAAALTSGLMVTGGDTATALLRAWQVRCLRLMEEIEPGMPLSVAMGARAILVVTKPGAFGSAATLTHARERMRASLDILKGTR